MIRRILAGVGQVGAVLADAAKEALRTNARLRRQVRALRRQVDHERRRWEITERHRAAAVAELFTTRGELAFERGRVEGLTQGLADAKAALKLAVEERREAEAWVDLVCEAEAVFMAPGGDA